MDRIEDIIKLVTASKVQAQEERSSGSSLKEMERNKAVVNGLSGQGKEMTMSDVWDNVLQQLGSVASATIQQNKELSERVQELETELDVWKQSRSKVAGDAEQLKLAHDTEKQALLRRISHLESTHDQTVHCIIDGDGNIFSDHLLRLGLEGGREAARILYGGITKYLEEQHIQLTANRSWLWLAIFLNRRGLQNALIANAVCDAEQFDAFLTGFSQAAPMFHVVDVGYGKEAADSKIKEYLRFYARFPQTLKIFFGGGHDNGYLPTLASLQNERLLNKIILLKGYNEIARELRGLDLPELSLSYVFRPVKLPQSPRPAMRSPMFGPTVLGECDMPQVTTGMLDARQGLASRPQTGASIHSVMEGRVQSPINGQQQHNVISPVSAAEPPPTKKKIDSSQPLWKRTPPPCNELYVLKRCPRQNCKYGHDYDLTEEQIGELKVNCKKMACFHTKKGMDCTYKERCIYGHYCPNGPKCFHLTQGKCWFKWPDAHNAPSASTTSQVTIA